MPRAPLAVRTVTVLLCCVAAALALGVAAAPTDAQADEEAALAEAQRELQSIRAEIDRAESAAEDAASQLEDADRTLARVEAVVNDVARTVDGQQAVLANAEQRLRRLEADQDRLVSAFNRRATRAFKLGPTTTLDLLLSGQDPSEAMARGAYLRVMLEGDQVDLEVLAASETAVSAERERADAERARLADLLEQQQVVLADAQQLRESRALEAANARDQLRRLEEQEDDLESEQERIEKLIQERQAEERRRAAAQREAAQATRNPGGPAVPGATSTSGYAWPMCAPVTSEYGPRWGRTHRGIDLGAPAGRAIGAAKEGTAISAGWQGGYGRLLLIDHGDGVVTAYAHLSSFGVGQGQSVQRGQTIGTVGTSGNVTGPHLHLEFRVNGRAVNPRQYLSGRPC